MRIGYDRSVEADRYSAVILAAGLSSRMKEFKPLLSVDGRTALAGLVESLRGAGIEDILVVSGHRAEDLRQELDRLRVEEVLNPDYQEGMFTSIKAGLAKARDLWPEKTGTFLLPVDCPLISIEVLKALMVKDAKRGNGSGIEEDDLLVPTYRGKKGHPLLIPTSRIQEILAYEGPNGLKGITDKGPRAMIRVPVNDEGCVMDMDTPESYEELRDFVAKGFKRDKLSVLSGRKRVIMIRHGQTRQHDEPMFIGQYDVPLSEEGREQTKAAAEKIVEIVEPDVQASDNWVEGISIGKEPLPPLENIYCSDLGRAVESAEIIADAIGKAYPKMDPEVIPVEGLREISLGEWDGRSIEEIRREYPEEYERRGKDIFTFKTGNHSENFYDLQYRAVKALREILATDYGRNIIIVAHSGVIRALENNLKGLGVDDQWEPLEKGGVRIWESPPVP